MILSSSVIILIVVAASFAEEDGAVAVQKGWYDSEGNFIPNNMPRDTTVSPGCCIIPTCVDYDRCYETLSCGYICSNPHYRKARSYNPTPKYKRRDYYSKPYCFFDRCRSLKFYCSQCPSPTDYDFNIDSINEECKNCYYPNSYWI